MHVWQAALVLKPNDKMYERIPLKFLPTAEIPDGRYLWVECKMYAGSLLRPLSPCIYLELSHSVPEIFLSPGQRSTQQLTLLSIEAVRAPLVEMKSCKMRLCMHLLIDRLVGSRRLLAAIISRSECSCRDREQRPSAENFLHSCDRRHGYR